MELNDPQIMPQLYAKIGTMQVQIEMLLQENEGLRVMLAALAPEEQPEVAAGEGKD